MTEHRDERYEQSVKEAAERLVEQRIHHARKEEVVVMYEDLLQTIWERLLPTLGRMTVCAIMERSLALTSERHAFMQQLKVTRDGVDFEQLRERLRDQDHDHVRLAMKEFVANLIDLLAMLTGDIIVRRLLTEIGGERIG